MNACTKKKLIGVVQGWLTFIGLLFILGLLIKLAFILQDHFGDVKGCVIFLIILVVPGVTTIFYVTTKCD